MLHVKRLVSTLSVIVAVFLVQPVFAQEVGVCTGLTGPGVEECNTCMADGKGAWTATGCLPTSPDAFIEKFITIGAGVAGGISLLLIIFGGLQMMAAAGNPEKLNEAKELIAAAITGLLLIIFSIFILRVIGYDILRIPGFERG